MKGERCGKCINCHEFEEITDKVLSSDPEGMQGRVEMAKRLYPCLKTFPKRDKPCEHKDFNAVVAVNRLEDVGKFQADVRIVCKECGIPFRFIGLPSGIDLNGAAVSAGGTEARLAVAPKGEVQAAVDGAPLGFTVRKPSSVCEHCGYDCGGTCF